MTGGAGDDTITGSVDDDLLADAFSVSDAKTKKQLIHEALRQYLAATLEAGVAAPSAPPELRTRTLGSYRIVGLERRPMVSRAFAEFDRSAREPRQTD